MAAGPAHAMVCTALHVLSLHTPLPPPAGPSRRDLCGGSQGAEGRWGLRGEWVGAGAPGGSAGTDIPPPTFQGDPGLVGPEGLAGEPGPPGKPGSPGIGFPGKPVRTPVPRGCAQAASPSRHAMATGGHHRRRGRGAPPELRGGFGWLRQPGRASAILSSFQGDPGGPPGPKGEKVSGGERGPGRPRPARAQLGGRQWVVPGIPSWSHIHRG